ncbi:MAG: hemerythrin domain-containing protein [Stellaceae bacterium]
MNKLLPHLEAEQEILYRRLETGKEEESRAFGHEGTSGHRMVEQQVDKMIGMGDTMGDQWTAELKVLQDLVEQHVDEEESTGFSCARGEFDKEQLEAMSA